jgi:hypothetical protein
MYESIDQFSCRDHRRGTDIQQETSVNDYNRIVRVNHEPEDKATKAELAHAVESAARKVYRTYARMGLNEPVSGLAASMLQLGEALDRQRSARMPGEVI